MTERKKVNSALIIYDPEHTVVRKWGRIDGKLCKEMSQESKGKLAFFEWWQQMRYLPLELPYTNIYKNKYIENHTPLVDEKGLPKPKRDWRRETREW